MPSVLHNNILDALRIHIQITLRIVLHAGSACAVHHAAGDPRLVEAVAERDQVVVHQEAVDVLGFGRELDPAPGRDYGDAVGGCGQRFGDVLRVDLVRVAFAQKPVLAERGLERALCFRADIGRIEGRVVAGRVLIRRICIYRMEEGGGIRTFQATRKWLWPVTPSHR